MRATICYCHGTQHNTPHHTRWGRRDEDGLKLASFIGCTYVGDSRGGGQLCIGQTGFFSWRVIDRTEVRVPDAD